MVSHPILEKVKQKLSCVTVTKASWNIPNPNVWSLLCWQSFSLSFATLFRASETSLVDRSGSGQPNCCKTVQGLRSQILSCSSYIFNCLRCFTMMSSIFFRPTAGRTAKQDFKFRCLNLTQLEVEKKNTGERETTGRWNLVICWFFVGFCGIGLPLGFYSCRTNTRDNSQLLFSPIFMDGKECFTLLNSWKFNL